MANANRKPRIVLGVTTDQSIMLMRGFFECLVDHGWEVHLVSGNGPTLESFKDKRGVTTHIIEMTRDPSPLRDLWSLLQWVHTLRRIRPDVVSVGTPKAGLLGTIAALSVRGAKRVYVLRGLRLETTSGAARFVLWAVEKLTMTASNRVIAVSPSLKTATVRMRLARAVKVSVLGFGSSNGVEIERFAPSSFARSNLLELQEKLGIDPNVPVIGFVGRLTKDKGIDVLASCRSQLVASGVDHQILVLGQVDAGSAEHWLKLLDQSGRPALMSGFVDDPAPYYQLMDVLALPSYREGFPNVALEAQASGIPVVTTDATGAVDSVQPGVSGTIIPVGDPTSLAKALMTTMADPSLYDRQRIIDGIRPFARETVQARHVAFYESLLPKNLLGER